MSRERASERKRACLRLCRSDRKPTDRRMQKSWVGLHRCTRRSDCIIPYLANNDILLILKFRHGATLRHASQRARRRPIYLCTIKLFPPLLLLLLQPRRSCLICIQRARVEAEADGGGGGSSGGDGMPGVDVSRAKCMSSRARRCARGSASKVHGWARSTVLYCTIASEVCVSDVRAPDCLPSLYRMYICM